MLVYSGDALPLKGKAAGRAALDARRKKHGLVLPDPAMLSDLRSPTASEIPVSKEIDSDEKLPSGSEQRARVWYARGAWPEWSEAEDEQQQSGTEGAKRD